VYKNHRGKPTWAVVGDVTLKKKTVAYRKVIPISEWIIHPNYTVPLIYNDIACTLTENHINITFSPSLD